MITDENAEEDWPIIEDWAFGGEHPVFGRCPRDDISENESTPYAALVATLKDAGLTDSEIDVIIGPTLEEE
jgi:hypothetical protein